MFPFEFHQEFDAHTPRYPPDILPYRSCFQITQISEWQLPATAAGNMHHFLEVRLEQDLEIRFQYMLSGENNSSLSVQHNKFSVHAHTNHLCRMLFPGDSLGHNSEVCPSE